MNHRLLIAALSLLSVPLSAESVIYRQTSEGKTTQETATLVRKAEAGLNWEVQTDKDGTGRTGRSADGTMVAAEGEDKDGKWILRVEADTLKASGEYKGKPVTGSLALKGRVWSLGFDQALKVAVVRKITAQLPFLLIDPTDVANPREILLTPDGKDTVEGRPALRYKLNLPGAMGMFWSAVVWADPVTGDQMKYKGNQGPGTPEMVMVITHQN